MALSDVLSTSERLPVFWKRYTVLLLGPLDCEVTAKSASIVNR